MGNRRKRYSFFMKMQGEGVSPNKFTFVQVIAGLGTLEDGRLVLSSLFKLVASLMSFWE